MTARPQVHPLDVSSEAERRLARRLERANRGGEPVVIEIAGNRYRLVPDDVQTTDDPAANYDPAKVLAALEAGAGALAGLDVDAFLEEIMEAREQDTPGHSF